MRKTVDTIVEEDSDFTLLSDSDKPKSKNLLELDEKDGDY